MRAAQSSHLNQFEYHAPSQTLTVQFVNGAVYSYAQVPVTVYDTLQQTSSPGTYFHDKIKGVYSAQKIADGVTKSGRVSRRRNGY